MFLLLTQSENGKNKVMPIYQHRCKKCLHRFEKLIPMSQANIIQTCPKCLSNATIRVISKTSFMLKGSGWAKDGYASQE
ncbi:MAG: transcriptional regulator [Euryarchaeota archaeon]|nr:transcriptional regulator [Euryarchaeota archaeon]